MKIARALVVLLLLAFASVHHIGVAQGQHWKWQAPYDPPPTLTPILKEKKVSVEEWRFCEAIRRQTLELVLHMLEQGSDPRMICSRYSPPDFPAILLALILPGARPEIVHALISKGADVNLRYTRAVEQPKANLSASDKLLLTMVNATRDTDYFPLYYAAAYTNASVVEKLLQLGANIHARTGVYGLTAILVTRDPEIAKVLVQFGADVNDKDAMGRTVLMNAQRSLSDLMTGHHLRP